MANLSAPCYWTSGVPAADIYPCGPTNASHPVVSCCAMGDTCLTEGLCQSGQGSIDSDTSYYVASCTSRTLSPHSVCFPARCRNATLPNAVWDEDSRVWRCCGAADDDDDDDDDDDGDDSDDDDDDNDGYPGRCEDVDSAENFVASAPELLEAYFIVTNASLEEAEEATTESAGRATATATASITATSSSSSSSGDISTGQKIAVGLGVGFGMIALMAIVTFLVLVKRRQVKKADGEEVDGEKGEHADRTAGGEDDHEPLQHAPSHRIPEEASMQDVWLDRGDSEEVEVAENVRRSRR